MMPRSRRFARACRAIALLATLVATTSCSLPILGPPPEPVEISFACSAEDEAFYAPLVADFTRQRSHITVNLIRYGSGFDWPEADVWEVSPFTRRFMDRYGYEPLDLTPFIERGDAFGRQQADFRFDRDDFGPELLDLFQSGDEVWAIPSALYVQGLYYNQDLFDRYGVAPPTADWTWEEFLQAGKALYRPQDGIYGYTPDRDKNDPFSFIYQNGGHIFDDLKNPTRTTFDHPATIEALEWYAALMHEQEAAATPYQARQAWGISGPVRAGIKAGKLAMWTGSITPGGDGLDGDPLEMNWGVVPLPMGKQRAALGFAQGYVISAQAENPDAAWEWLVYLTHQVPPYGVPIRASVLASQEFEDQVGQDVAAAARTSIEHVLLLSDEAWEIYGQFQTFSEALARIYSGMATPYEAMQWAQETSQFKEERAPPVQQPSSPQ
jgi:ABC-type glycerol-3-phosphate transport system substrate-binding protein